MCLFFGSAYCRSERGSWYMLIYVDIVTWDFQKGTCSTPLKTEEVGTHSLDLIGICTRGSWKSSWLGINQLSTAMLGACLFRWHRLGYCCTAKKYLKTMVRVRVRYWMSLSNCPLYFSSVVYWCVLPILPNNSIPVLICQVKPPADSYFLVR